MAILYSLGWILLLASSRAMEVSTTTFPQIVEVDLIFPRNGSTYAPGPLLPFVWAVQNFRVAKPLYLTFVYSLDQVPPTSTNAFDQLRLGYITHNSTDPFFFYRSTYKTNDTESDWKFVWQWRVGGCKNNTDPSNEGTELGEVVLTGGDGGTSEIYFSTKKGAPQPDLAAATKDGTCDKTPAYTINMTDVLDVPLGTRYFDHLPTCPVLSTITPTPNPCGAKIDDAAASSISYALQSSACLGGSSAYVTCPPGAKNSAPRVKVISTQGLTLLMTTLAWLVL